MPQDGMDGTTYFELSGARSRWVAQGEYGIGK